MNNSDSNVQDSPKFERQRTEHTFRYCFTLYEQVGGGGHMICYCVDVGVYFELLNVFLDLVKGLQRPVRGGTTPETER